MLQKISIAHLFVYILILHHQLTNSDGAFSHWSNSCHNTQNALQNTIKRSDVISYPNYKKTIYSFIRPQFKSRLENITLLRRGPLDRLNTEKVYESPGILLRSQKDLTKSTLGEGDWIVLHNGSILKQIRKHGEGPKISSINNNITIEFEITRMSGQKLISNHDLEISMLEFPLLDANPGMTAALMSMKRLESATFILSPELHNLKGNLIGEHVIGSKEWLIFNIELCNFLHTNDSWEGFKPDMNLTWLPPDTSHENDYQNEIELKEDLLLKQIQEKMETDSNSPYWSDISEQMNPRQLEKVDDHFLKKSSKEQNRFKGVSRGFTDSLNSKSTVHGYSIGDKLEGRSRNYIWRETPFEIELLFPISNYLKPSDMNCTIIGKQFEITIQGNQVFKDELLDRVDSSDQPFWIINQSKNQTSHDDNNKDLVKFQKATTTLRETAPEDCFDILEKSPCISILLSKKGPPKLWGNIFLKS